MFVRMMRGFAAFHQVEVLTWCVMNNHFHLLIRVPERPEGFSPDSQEVMALLEPAVGKEWSTTLHRQWEIFGNNGCVAAIEQWRQRMVDRMYSLSWFLKSLKQRFTQWYNRRTGRNGTLWEGRFRSVIVEDEAKALRTMATYM